MYSHNAGQQGKVTWCGCGLQRVFQIPRGVYGLLFSYRVILQNPKHELNLRHQTTAVQNLKELDCILTRKGQAFLATVFGGSVEDMGRSSNCGLNGPQRSSVRRARRTGSPRISGLLCTKRALFASSGTRAAATGSPMRRLIPPLVAAVLTPLHSIINIEHFYVRPFLLNIVVVSSFQ